MMRPGFDPFRLLLVALAGRLNQQQQDVIDYLQEENHVLREQLGGKRLRFNNDQRRRLAVRAKKLGWRMLHELTTMVTPATLLAWHRRLIAEKCDGSKQRGPDRPRRKDEIQQLEVWLATRIGLGATGESGEPWPTWVMRSRAAPSPTFGRSTG